MYPLGNEGQIALYSHIRWTGARFGKEICQS